MNPTVTAYGPRVTEARVRELRAAFSDLAVALEVMAQRAAEGSVILHGRVSRVFALARELSSVNGMLVHHAGDGGEAWCVAAVSRGELAELLDARGREGDAAKVHGGPPDQPAPEGARLLVCAVDGDCVAVTWSHPPLRAIGRGRIL